MKRAFIAFAAPVILACWAAPPVGAETCPQAPDHSDALNALYDQVQAAPDEATARRISDQMWTLWADAPNEQAQAILDRGMSQRASYDFAGAVSSFDRLTEYCPEYAEGFNQRAFVHYLRQDYAAALVDLDRAIAISPDHVAALSGKALSL